MFNYDPKALGRGCLIWWLQFPFPYLLNQHQLINFVGLVFIGFRLEKHSRQRYKAKSYSGIWYRRAGDHGKNLYFFVVSTAGSKCFISK